MAYNEELAERIRAGLKGVDYSEKKMFGGLSFMYRNKMAVGVIKNDLCVRVISEKCDKVLQSEYVRPMDFTGKPLKEFVYVQQAGIPDEKTLQEWIELGLEHATIASS